MNGHERAEHVVEDLFEVERATHVIDPESDLGRAMVQARESWGDGRPPDPEDFDWSSVRPEPVTE